MAKRHIIHLKEVEDVNILIDEWMKDEKSDRSYAVIGGTLVENCLEKYLRSCMRDLRISKGRTILSDLFDGTGPLTSFSGKIRAAFAFGLIGPSLFNDVDAIREIRNTFAHNIYTANSTVALSFKAAEIVEQAKKLRPSKELRDLLDLPDEAVDKRDDNYKLRFYAVTTTIGLCLTIAAEDKESVIQGIIRL